MTTDSTPLVRRASEQDATMLAGLAARTFHDAFAADNKAEDMDAYMSVAFTPEKLRDELSAPDNIFFVAEIDAVPVGYAQLRAGDAPPCVTGPRPAEVARLYVSRDWLGRGVGEALMSACVEQARAAGHQTVWLGVWEHNPRAQAFYRKWGFRHVGQHVFQLGSDAQIDWLMERDLISES